MIAMRALLLSLALLAGSVSAADNDAVVQAPAAAIPAATPVEAPATTRPAAAPAVAASAAPSAPTAAPSSAGSLLQVVFGLLVVLGLLAAALWFLKRMGGGRFAPGSVVKIIGGVSVGNRERVMVVEVADQWIVIGVAPGRVSTLASMPRQDTPAAQAAAGAPNFSAWLKQTIEKRNAN
jgi:flagellar protein FliO/FliZ